MAQVILGKLLDVTLPDGNVIRLQPGPKGVGFSLTTLAAKAKRGGGKGRPLSPERLELRELMTADHAKGELADAKHYLDWFVKRSSAKRPYASHVVKQELDRLGGVQKVQWKVGGRQASKATLVLRDQLNADRAAGQVHDAVHYVRWLVKKADIGIKKARPIVYRELRAVKS